MRNLRMKLIAAIAALLWPVLAAAQQRAEGFLAFQDSVPAEIISAEVTKRLVRIDTVMFTPFRLGQSSVLPAGLKARLDSLRLGPDQCAFFRGLADDVGWKPRYSKIEWDRLNRSLAQARAEWVKTQVELECELMLTPLIEQPAGRRGFAIYIATYESVRLTAASAEGKVFFVNELGTPVMVTLSPFDLEQARSIGGEQAKRRLSVSDNLSLTLPSGYWRIDASAVGRTMYRALIEVEQGDTTPVLLDLALAARPSVLADVGFEAGVGLTSVFASGAQYTAPTISLSFTSGERWRLTLSGGWRPVGAEQSDSFGRRAEAVAAAEIIHFPHPTLGASLGVRGAWEMVRSEDEFLERAYGVSFGPRVRLFDGQVILGLDGQVFNVSAFGRQDAWKFGVSTSVNITLIR